MSTYLDVEALTEKVIIDLKKVIKIALEEDIGSGDISSELLEDKLATARIITRDRGIYCGDLWIEAVFQELEHEITITQHKQDAEICQEGDALLTLTGPLRQLLSIERTLLNGIQLLCGVANQTYQFVHAIRGLECAILDTRKTIPGWRRAQKYAVRVGGGKNHRMGLYDEYLLKENHQLSNSNIIELIHEAKKNQAARICVEVENIEEFERVLPSAPQQILLDNFSLVQLKKAVTMKRRTHSTCFLEASGNVDLDNVRKVAQTGVDFISIGAITKNIKAMDLSMRILEKQL